MEDLTADTIEQAWRDRSEQVYRLIYGRIHVPEFGGDVRLRVYPEDGAAPLIPPAVMEHLAALRAAATIPRITSLLAEHCRSCCLDISYGLARPGEDETLSNYAAFNLTPEGEPPEGWYSPAWLRCLMLDATNTNGDFSSLRFLPPWEDEHGLDITVREGKLVEFNP